MRITRFRIAALLISLVCLIAAAQDVYRRGQPARLRRPLTRAVYRRDAAAVRFLLAQGTDPNSRENYDPPPTFWQTLRNLLLPGRSHRVQLGVNDRPTVLMDAAHLGDVDTVRLLLGSGADANARLEPGGITALMVACGNGHTEIVRLLLARGADPNARDKLGEPVLLFAVMGARPEVVQTIVAHGVDVNAASRNGMTPLMWAMQSPKQTTIVRLLKRAGAHP